MGNQAPIEHPAPRIVNKATAGPDGYHNRGETLFLGFHLKSFPPFTWPVDILDVKVGKGLRGIQGYPPVVGHH